MKKYIIIEADTNDGDYVTEVTEITDEQIQLIEPVVESIKNFTGHHHNYETGEMVDKADAQKLYGHLEGFELFDGFVPVGDENYPGIHTISSIKIVQELEELL